MLTTCEIELENNPEKVIYAGQSLGGDALLALTKIKNVRAAYIQIYRKAQVMFSDPDSQHKSEQNLFSEQIYIVQSNGMLLSPYSSLSSYI